MDLISYIKSVGDEEAARVFKVKVRTVRAWRLKERRPQFKHAKVIVEKSPVTWDGIYQPDLNGHG